MEPDEADPFGIVLACTAPSCGLRYPAQPKDPRARPCPGCGAEVETVAVFGASAPGPASNSDAVTAWVTDATAAGSLVIVADNLRSAYNVGSLFRTADGVGATHVHLCGITAPADHSSVAKTALGAERAVPSSSHPDALHVVEELIADGFEVWAMETTPDAVNLHTITSFGQHTAVVFGNEVHGIDPGILNAAAHHAALPMSGMKHSLNVAVAAGASLYWIAAHRP